MANKMLIDASHPEETRVVVLRGNRVEEFDFESANKKQLRGNIYLAKVTRVEPSLQAAFVDYGGNRHGFLAFSEIHPDYYQIPVSDRQALIEEDARAHRDEDSDDNRGSRRRSRRNRRPSDRAEKRSSGDETVSEAAPSEHGAELLAPAATDEAHHSEASTDNSSEAESPEVIAVDDAGFAIVETMSESGESAAFEQAPQQIEAAADSDVEAKTDEAGEAPSSQPEAEASSHGEVEEQPRHQPAKARRSADDSDEDEEDEHIENIGGDAMEEMPARAYRPRRQYKIQEVIKRRQVLLIQVVKEERGNKGAALTTFLSLAGRYSVLMPNTARGGGISRKITDLTDRKRLKAIAQELEVPEGMGIILRTAGAARTKAEVKRDFEYLLRMWETVRELTLRSTAPSLVYEEGSLIKRSIRDLYNKDIDEVIVAGDNGYKEAKDFMRLLMPSHAKNVQPYRDDQPIFAKAGAEAQLDAMFSNQVTLKSGGYLVINQTEALVAIDVNSGRSTREHNIEDTALRTNLEAADEVARQLRLRDLAGLIVVDLIDMEESRNDRAVERRLKEALKNDRARIQVGRISHFGLLEMSRQRIRTGVLEGSTVVCPHCAGAGMVRSTSSIALHVLRVLEDALIKNAANNIIVRARTEVALYILNQKRSHLTELERRFGVAVSVIGDDTLTGTTYHALERGEPVLVPLGAPMRNELVRIDSIAPAPFVADEPEEEPAAEESESPSRQRDHERSRDRRPQRERHERQADHVTAEHVATERGDEVDADRPAGETESEGNLRRRRRRRRRGGRDREGGQMIEANAPQPSDEGLAVLVEIDSTSSGAPRSVDEFSGEDEGAETEGDAVATEATGEARPEGDQRRRRARRGGRNRRPGQRSEPFPGLGEVEPVQEGMAETADGTQDWREPRESHEPPAPAHAEEHVETIVHAPAPVVVAPVPAPTFASVEPSTPQPVVDDQPKPLELPEAEPPGQKRSGWWQRAKATIVGH